MKSKTAFELLAASALIFLLYHGFAYLGHFGFDDLHYAELASGLAKGQVDWGDHFSFRWALLGLTALSYKLFGVGDLASSLPALLLTLATLAMVFLVLRKHSVWAVAAGLALFTLNHWTLFYADKLMPDVYVAFFGLAALLVYYVSLRYRASIWLPQLFSLLLLGALLSKETTLLLAPLLLFWLVRDLIRKEHHRFWLVAAISGIVLLGGYLLVTWHLTGNPLGRFRAIIANQYVSFCDYAAQPFRELAVRITWGLLRELTHQGMMAGFALLLPVFFLGKGAVTSHSLRFFTTASLLLLLSANFMPVSLFPYNPMCTDPRHYLFLIPVFSIAGGLALVTFYENRRYRLLVFLTALLLSFLLIPVKSPSLAEQMVPLALLALAGLFTGKSRDTLTTALVLLTLILAIKPFRFALYAREVDYPGQRNFLKTNVLENSFDLIITDDVQKRLIRYYGGFEEGGPEVSNWQEAENLPDREEAVIALLTNSYTRYLSGDQPGELPFFAADPGLIARPVVVDTTLHLSLYTTRSWHKPSLLARHTHGFETDQAGWTLADGVADTVAAFNGVYSNKPGEFSATFRCPSDSLGIPLPTHLLVSCRLQFMTASKTNASLVLSVDQNQGEDLWEAFPLFPQTKAFSVWSAVSIHTVIKGESIKPGSQISVYIWNPGRDEIRTDDWEITFSGLREY